jgi:hypothetical protein
MPEVIIGTPTAYRHSQGRLDIKHEEDALCWLWAFPSLLPWRQPIVWLYTPVVGNKRWPGDLWGVDSNGDLLIIECKQCKQLDDPFQDFIPYHAEHKDELSAVHWQGKFLRHLKQELAYPNCYTTRPIGRTGGILPRSNKRQHIRRWRQLAKLVDVRIRAPQYRELALGYLQTRASRHDPTPYYLALLAVRSSNQPLLSKQAKESWHTLQAKVGADHVRVVTATGELLQSNQLRVVMDEVFNQ